MLKNHLKSIYRSLRNNKAYTAINISGLAIGFTAAILIDCCFWNGYHTNSNQPSNIQNSFNEPC